MTDQIPARPEMKAGTPDLFVIDTMTAIQMGPRNLKKYMYEIQEEGKKLDLVVKVEKTDGGLILWWYPKTMEEKLEGAAEAFDLTDVAQFQDNSVAYVGDNGEVRSTWKPDPLSFWDSVTQDNTFLDDIMQHIRTIPKGELYAEKALVYAGQAKNIEELIQFLYKICETEKIRIDVTESLDLGTQLYFEWRPEREALADDQTAPPA